MRILTLIPEANTYGLAVLVINGLGCFTLASHLHARYFADRGVNILTVNIFVKGAVVGWGLLVLDARQLFDVSPSGLTAGVALGLLGGWSAFNADRGIGRYLSRRRLWSRQRITTSFGRDIPSSTAVKNNVLPESSQPRATFRRQTGPQKALHRFTAAERPNHFGLWHSVVLAVLEELIFRGFLVASCLLLPSGWLAALGLAGTTLIFVLSHISFGWAQVLSKTPLALITLTLTLASSSIVAAMVSHVAFNISIWRAVRDRPPVAHRPQPRRYQLG